VVIGAPATHRRHAWWEPLIGLFVNTLVYRHRIDESLTVRGWLRTACGVTDAALAHQDLPFEQVVEAAQAPRDQSHTPVFQVMMVHQHPPAPLPLLRGLSALQPLAPPVTTAKVDLSLYLAHDAGQAAFEYNTDLFDEATVLRLAGHWRTLLAAFARDPELPLSRLSLVDEKERRRLVEQWSCDGAEPLASADLLAMWRGRVVAVPETVAVTDGFRLLSYAGFAAAVDRTAHGLRSLGVKPGQTVGISLARSTDLAVAVAAVLTAGAAYLPLDPAYPPARLAVMRADAAPTGVIEATGEADWSPQALRQAGLRDGDDHSLDTIPGGPAYVIFTSGSTGRPKGVWLGREPLARLIRCAELFRTFMQTCLFACNGVPPSAIELEAYIARIAEIVGRRIPVAGVLL